LIGPNLRHIFLSSTLNFLRINLLIRFCPKITEIISKRLMNTFPRITLSNLGSTIRQFLIISMLSRNRKNSAKISRYQGLVITLSLTLKRLT
jgi:hypothetical protein